MRIISAAKKYTLPVWKYASRSLTRFFPESSIVVIVPDRDVRAFKRASPSEVLVEGESAYVSEFQALLQEKCGQINPARTGWYRQQLIKLEAMARFRAADPELVIWDADAVPIRHFSFFGVEGDPLYLRGIKPVFDNGGNRYDLIHPPYFQSTQKILRLQTVVSHSWITQTFPIRSDWMSEFLGRIERIHGCSWWEAIVNSIDFSENSGFSEYETLGTFVSNEYPERVQYSPIDWELNGWQVCGSPRRAASKSGRKRVHSSLGLLGFEKWQRPLPKNRSWSHR